MPELPEVEVVRLGLLSHALGRRIDHLEVLHPRPVRSHPFGAEGMRADLEGRAIDDIRRKGKFMWLVLGDDALVVHLGMSGQLRVNLPTDEHLRNTRVLFRLADGNELRFVDQRMFGGLTFHPGAATDPVPHIALDPFDPEFDPKDVGRRMRLRNTTVKRALLDQRFVSGIGNIYADESLWRTRLHFEQPTSSVSARKATEVFEHARDVMAEALEQGGTSFDSLYVHVNGESGYFSRSLAAYGREGLPCDRCGTPIIRRQFANRSSFLCPRCQRMNRGGRS